MTCIIFTSNPQNYSILKFPPIHESQIKPSNPSRVIRLQCKTIPEKDDSEINDYLKKIIDDMFAESAEYRKAAVSKPTLRVIEGGRNVKPVTVSEKVTEEGPPVNAPSPFSRSYQGMWGKLSNLKKYPIVNFLLCTFLKGEKK